MTFGILRLGDAVQRWLRHPEPSSSSQKKYDKIKKYIYVSFQNHTEKHPHQIKNTERCPAPYFFLLSLQKYRLCLPARKGGNHRFLEPREIAHERARLFLGVILKHWHKNRYSCAKEACLYSSDLPRAHRLSQALLRQDGLNEAVPLPPW